MLLAAAFWLAAFWPKDLYQPMNTTASVFFQLSSKNETTVPPEPPYPFKACVKSWCSGTLNWSAASVISQRNAEMVGRLFVPGCSVTAFLGGFTSGRIPLYIYIYIYWLVVENMNCVFPFSWECRHPNWRTRILKGVVQPPTRYLSIYLLLYRTPQL